MEMVFAFAAFAAFAYAMSRSASSERARVARAIATENDAFFAARAEAAAMAGDYT